MRYALNQWGALTRFLEDGELEIDNGATERANCDIALGRGYAQALIMYSSRRWPLFETWPARSFVFGRV